MQGLTVCNLNKICLKRTGNKLKLYHTFLSLPRIFFFWMSRNASLKVLLGERYVTSKKRLRGRLYFSPCCDEVIQRGASHSGERDKMSFLYNSKKTLDFLYNERQGGD